MGWYYGRLSPHSIALVHEVYEEMNLPLLYESDAYSDDVPFWVDVPAEKNEENPKGMLMIPYRYTTHHIPRLGLLHINVDHLLITFLFIVAMIVMMSSTINQPVSVRCRVLRST